MYEVILPRRIRKSMVRQLPESAYRRVLAAIQGLANGPRPRGAIKMWGTGGLEEWRIRLGDYRVVYRIEEAGQPPEDEEELEGRVIVLAVGHRQGIYG